MNAFQRALQQAWAMVGLDPDGATLLRVGSNAVYQLKASVVARISRPGTDAGPVRRSVAVARWLEAVDYPAVRAVDVDQPVIVGGYVVTFWQSVFDYGDQFASTPKIAALLARLHHLTVPEGLHWTRSPRPSHGCKTSTQALNSSSRRESSTLTRASATSCVIDAAPRS